MLTEDYFMRMINQMLAVLTKIIGLKEAGQYQAAQEIINQSLEQLLGMRSRLLKQMDDSSLMNILTTQGELVSDRLYMVANLYKLEGDIFLDQKLIAEANQDYQRALTFYLEIALRGEDQFSPELNDKIDELRQVLAEQQLTVELHYLLFDYYSRVGSFNLVEEHISSLLHANDDSLEFIPDLINYYDNLLEKSDAELAAGGISRDKVRKNLEGIINKYASFD
jgi:hypothetical protein